MTTPKLSLPKRIAFWALTLLLLLALAEAGLQIVSMAIRPKVAIDGRISDCEGIVFLTIGDSMTFGLGAPKGKSYPAQLPPFFTARYPGIAAKTYNLGIPGTNTSEGLQNLRRFVEEKGDRTAPDFALVMYGVNNRWNLHDASFWDFNKEAKGDNTLKWLVSELRLNKVFSVAAQEGEAVAELKYGRILHKHGWDIFFKDFTDDLLSLWISRDLKTMTAMLRDRGVEPVFLTYFVERFGGLNPLIRRVGDEAGVRVLDMEQPPSYYRKRRFFSKDWFHLNGRGYGDASWRAMEAFSRQFSRKEIEQRLAAKKASAACAARRDGRAH